MITPECNNQIDTVSVSIVQLTIKFYLNIFSALLSKLNERIHTCGMFFVMLHPEVNLDTKNRSYI